MAVVLSCSIQMLDRNGAAAVDLEPEQQLCEHRPLQVLLVNAQAGKGNRESADASVTGASSWAQSIQHHFQSPLLQTATKSTRIEIAYMPLSGTLTFSKDTLPQKDISFDGL